MKNTNSRERKKESSLVKEIAKVSFIPGYFVKYYRDAEIEAEIEEKNALSAATNRNKVKRIITYSSVVGHGVCLAGLYYKMAIEPLYNLLVK